MKRGQGYIRPKATPNIIIKPKQEAPRQATVDEIVKKALEEYGKQLTEEICKRGADEMAAMLWQMENYMSAANVIISLVAVEKTFGELKTVQKGIKKLLQNFNAAMEYVDERGIQETYKELQDRYGIEIALDDTDIEAFFDKDALVEKVGKGALEAVGLEGKEK